MIHKMAYFISDYQIKSFFGLQQLGPCCTGLVKKKMTEKDKF